MQRTLASVLLTTARRSSTSPPRPSLAREFGARFEGELDAEEVILQDGELKVTAFEVDHDPIRPAVGYRFDWKGRSVTFTGDTAMTPNLVENAKGSDILVSESLVPALVGMVQGQMKAAGNSRVAKIMADIPDYHISPVMRPRLQTKPA